MLVIRCREGESVTIGNEIEVTILASGPGKVKLGFKAPVSVPVARRCIELTRRQNHAAVHITDSSLVENLSEYLSGDETGNLTYMVSLRQGSGSAFHKQEMQRNNENDYTSRAPS